MEAARRLDIELTVASEHDSAFSEAEPAGLLTVDFGDPEGGAAQVAAFHAQHPVAAVFGVDDETAVVAAWASAAMGLPHSPIRAVETAANKYRQRLALRQHGVPVPDFSLHDIDVEASSLARGVRFPCVLKPVSLSASRGVIRANNASEFERAFGRVRAILEEPDVAARGEMARHLLVEDYVAGAEFALEGLLVDGGLHVLALFDKPDPLDGPFFAETIYVTPSRRSPDVQQALVDCAASACRALGLETGPVHIELRHNDAGPWLIELAARPIGGRCGEVLRFGEGGAVSLEQLLLGHALGMIESVPMREPGAAGVMMVPVPRAGVLQRVRGIAEAVRIAGITDVVVTAYRGQRLVPLPEESRYPAFIFARGETPEQVEAAIREASAVVELVLE